MSKLESFLLFMTFLAVVVVLFSLFVYRQDGQLWSEDAYWYWARLEDGTLGQGKSFPWLQWIPGIDLSGMPVFLLLIYPLSMLIGNFMALWLTMAIVLALIGFLIGEIIHDVTIKDKFKCVLFGYLTLLCSTIFPVMLKAFLLKNLFALVFALYLLRIYVRGKYNEISDFTFFVIGCCIPFSIISNMTFALFFVITLIITLFKPFEKADAYIDYVGNRVSEINTPLNRFMNVVLACTIAFFIIVIAVIPLGAAGIVKDNAIEERAGLITSIIYSIAIMILINSYDGNKMVRSFAYFFVGLSLMISYLNWFDLKPTMLNAENVSNIKEQLKKENITLVDVCWDGSHPQYLSKGYPNSYLFDRFLPILGVAYSNQSDKLLMLESDPLHHSFFVVHLISPSPSVQDARIAIALNGSPVSCSHIPFAQGN